MRIQSNLFLAAIIISFYSCHTQDVTKPAYYVGESPNQPVFAIVTKDSFVVSNDNTQEIYSSGLLNQSSGKIEIDKNTLKTTVKGNDIILKLDTFYAEKDIFRVFNRITGEQRIKSSLQGKWSVLENTFYRGFFKKECNEFEIKPTQILLDNGDIGGLNFHSPASIAIRYEGDISEDFYLTSGNIDTTMYPHRLRAKNAKDSSLILYIKEPTNTMIK